MRIAVFGAGAVGCFVGGRLAAAGGEVVLVGRPRLRAEVAAGLTLTDWRGGHMAASAEFAEGAPAVAGAGLVLVCVKSADTGRAAEALRPHLAPGAVIVSFQNGIGNARALAEGTGHPVLPGMVGFNVAAMGQGRFHQGTDGALHVGRAAGLPLDLFARAGLPLVLRDDMGPVLWAKLMLNLNNAINALSGLPLRDELAQRGYRRCLALAQQELLDLCARAGQPLARLTPLPAGWLPAVLRLPDGVFRGLAGSMLRIDPLARSSTADDLALGRVPETRWINGEVVRLAERLGRDAPVNRALCRLVDEAAADPARPALKAPDLWRVLAQAASRNRDLPRMAHRG